MQLAGPPSRPIRAAAATVGVLGALALAGCGNAQAEPNGESTADTSASAPSSAPAESGAYKDGEYTATGTYDTPGGVESITVTLTLSGDAVDAVTVTGEPKAPESKNFQGQFIDGIDEIVVGKSIDELKVDRVAGSSLTSGGFNKAIEQIKADAAG